MAPAGWYWEAHSVQAKANATNTECVSPDPPFSWNTPLTSVTLYRSQRSSPRDALQLPPHPLHVGKLSRAAGSRSTLEEPLGVFVRELRRVGVGAESRGRSWLGGEGRLMERMVRLLLLKERRERGAPRRTLGAGHHRLKHWWAGDQSRQVSELKYLLLRANGASEMEKSKRAPSAKSDVRSRVTPM